MVELLVCRACGTESEDYRSLFKKGILLGEVTTFAAILNYCTDTNALEGDRFPHSICAECVKCLCKLYTFKKMVEKTNAAFVSGKFGNKNINVQEESQDQEEAQEQLKQEEQEEQHEEEQIIEPIQYITEEIVESGELEGLATAAQIKRALDKMEYVALAVLPELNETQNVDEEFIETQNEEHLELDDEFTTKQMIVHDDVIAEEAETGYITDDTMNVDIEPITIKNNATNSFESYEITLLDQTHNKPDFITESEAEIELQVAADTETVTIEQISDKKTLIPDTKYRRVAFINTTFKNDLSNDNINNNSLINGKNTRRYSVRSKKSIKEPNPDLQCKICNKQLSNLHSFRYHMQLHSDEHPYLCSLCGDSFKTRNSYEGHIILHNPNNPNTCEICGKSYRQPSSLRTHMMSHTGEKPFQCDICGKGMTQKSGYKKHMLIHTGEKPHTCEICGRDFRYSSNLIAHKRCHLGEKPYACAICDKCFLSQEQLKRHWLVHNEDKPFSCELCDKTFKRRSSLTAHKLTHSTITTAVHREFIEQKLAKTNLIELY